MSDDIKKLIEVFEKCDLFFKEALEGAKANQRVGLSKEATAYLLWLLLLGLREDPHSNPKTTIKRYINAFTGKGPESFRDIGDWALLLTGVWWESLVRKPVGQDYYIGMGELSYSKEAETNRKLSDLFEELSDNFIKLVSILTEATDFISKKDPDKITPMDILKMYDKWLRTHEKFLERKLKELGIDPINIPTTKQ